MKIRIGVLGCANIAERSVLPAIKSLSNVFELKAISSRSLEKANDLAAKFDCEAIHTYESLLERNDIDAVYIPLPTGLHYEYINKSLDSGKHVFCEKSIAENYSQVTDLVEKAKTKDLVLMENFMFEYHSQQKSIKEILDSGEIGDIRFMKSSFGFPPFSDTDNIRYKKQLGGGAILDAGGYPLKAAQLFFGPNLKLKGSHLYYDKSLGVDLWGSAILETSDSATGIHLAFSFDNYYQCNYEFWGTKGFLKCHRAFTARENFKPKVTLEKNNTTETIELEADNHFINILKRFHTVISNNELRDTEYAKVLNQARLLTEIRNHAN